LLQAILKMSKTGWIHNLLSQLLITCITIWHYEPGWRSRYSDWLQAGWPRGWSWSLSGGKNFHFSMSSRLALGPTQPHIQRVPYPNIKYMASSVSAQADLASPLQPLSSQLSLYLKFFPSSTFFNIYWPCITLLPRPVHSPVGLHHIIVTRIHLSISTAVVALGFFPLLCTALSCYELLINANPAGSLLQWKDQVLVMACPCEMFPQYTILSLPHGLVSSEICITHNENKVFSCVCKVGVRVISGMRGNCHKKESTTQSR
jgi:hypothetical protein